MLCGYVPLYGVFGLPGLFVQGRFYAYFLLCLVFVLFCGAWF
ncbi:hypothetical protein YpUG050454_4262 [Yersinia pestis biovar Antiqua str. UG05-0454]|nr:hypothetical protein YpUG050454_4262 [Yersinia pestis biovar Antiqua str. UG05-0454]